MSPFTSNSLTHITDLHATILSLAEVEPEVDLDGIDHWEFWMNGGEDKSAKLPRTEVLLNLNSPLFAGSGAIIKGDYKYMVNPNPKEASIYLAVRNGLRAFSGQVTDEDVKNIIVHVHETMIGEPERVLFNIKENPTEVDSGDCDVIERCGNLYDLPQYADVVAAFEKRWAEFVAQSAPSTVTWEDDGPLADPNLFGGYWVPWRDGENSPKALYTGFDSLDLTKNTYNKITNEISDLATSGPLAASPSAVAFATNMTMYTVFGLFLLAVGFKVGSARHHDKYDPLP